MDENTYIGIILIRHYFYVNDKYRQAVDENLVFRIIIW